MGVETVDGVEAGGQLRALLRQIIPRAAAQDQHVDAVLEIGQRRQWMDSRAGMRRSQRSRVAAGEDAAQLHVLAQAQRQLCAAAQIAVTDDACSYSVRHVISSA